MHVLGGNIEEIQKKALSRIARSGFFCSVRLRTRWRETHLQSLDPSSTLSDRIFISSP